MIFSLSTTNCPKLSYMLCKHPDNVYERDLGGRKLIGKFPKKSNDQLYQINIVPDPMEFLKMAKKRNLDCYLNSEISCVCPYNLKGIHEALRSLIRGINASVEVVSQEVFDYKDYNISCILGPFQNDPEYVSGIFEKVGIDVSIVGDKSIETEAAFMYEFSLAKDTRMSIVEFLQKIYIISMYITYDRYSVFTFDENLIEKIILLSKGWLLTNPLLFPVMNKFCRYHESLRNKFQETLKIELEDGDEKDEVLQRFEKKLKNISLHERRHKFVIDKLKKIGCSSLVDFCTSEGKLLQAIIKEFDTSDTKILGIESNFQKVKQLSRKLSGNPSSRVIESDILHPNIDAGDLFPDVLTCIEAIEHFDKSGRERMIELIRDLFIPKYLFLTTPNVEYNINYGMEPNQYRRKDHVIEYNTEEFMKEVVEPLSEIYEIEFHSIVPDEDVQPSFCIFCTHKSIIEPKNIRTISKPYKNQKDGENKLFTITIDDSWTKERIEEWLTNDDYRKQRNTKPTRTLNHKFLRRIKNNYRTVYLPSCGYSVRENELVSGYTSRAFMENSKNIFYLAPTIAPVDSLSYGEANDYIEHPWSAFNYYDNRGITELIEEKKYMGSRAYILAFRDIDTAERLGFNSKIIINSRNGFPFFNSTVFLNEIHTEIMANLDLHYDYIMLDAEITPWSFKAEGLINKQFRGPAECLYLSRKFQGENADSCIDFLNVLNQFSKDTPINVFPFHILCKGNTLTKNVIHGYYGNHKDMMIEIESLCKGCDYLQPCSWNTVNLKDEESKAQSVERWKQYCNYNKDGVLGEGFVYKPLKFMEHTRSGYYIQPALKVRGHEYLRLVYGIDMYSIQEYFDMLKQRSINKKRSLAAQQFEMSKLILDTFVQNDKNQRLQFVAAFIGMENVSFGIDRTL